MSPDGQYEVVFEGVDDRGWIEKLFGLGYSVNGLSRIVIVEQSSSDNRKEVATFLESDPGSGRSYRISWSEDSVT